MATEAGDHDEVEEEEEAVPAKLPGTAPLENYRIVGWQANWYQPDPSAPKKPGGCCWHCSTGIAIEVIIEDKTTGERHTIGTTCAEKVGLSKDALKAINAERYAEARVAEREARLATRRKERAKADAKEAALHGPHGTEGRFGSGCRCTPCQKAAPHGTVERFMLGKCRCLDCMGAAVANGGWKVADQEVLVGLETGRVVDAKVVMGRYGRSWCIDDGREWAPYAPKNRATLAKRGYTEATAPFLCEVAGGRYHQWLEPLEPVGEPIVDRWGDPIPRSVSTGI
jgi:hypothetical protein